ncbi:hypothetical protein M758_2G129900 [Ceratodon purpureus]|nr:hypothetical protein M758_2G129900 [Ceratodon purpureus]
MAVCITLLLRLAATDRLLSPGTNKLVTNQPPHTPPPLQPTSPSLCKLSQLCKLPKLSQLCKLPKLSQLCKLPKLSQLCKLSKLFHEPTSVMHTYHV